MSRTPTFTPEDLVRVRRLSALDVSPDGGRAVFLLDELNGEGDVWDSNLHRLELGEAGAVPVPLTADTRKKAAPRFRPDGGLGLLCEPDPNERRPKPREKEKDESPKKQLHLLDVAGGAPVRLTDLPGGVLDYRWSADGSRLVLLSPVHPESRDLDHERELRKERSEAKATGVVHEGWPLRYWDRFLGPDHAHLIVAGPDGEDARDLTPGLGFAMLEASFDVSPDGATVAVDWREVDSERRVWMRVALVDAESGERRLIGRGTENAWSPRFSPDGRRLAFLSGRREPGATGKRDLVVLDLAADERRVLSESIDLWPESFEWIDSERLAWTADDRGRHVLRVQDAAGGEARAVTSSGCVKSWRVLPGGADVLAGIDRFDSPVDLHRVSLSGGAPERLTNLNPELDGRLPSGESVAFEGADGREVQAWEVRPKDFDPEKRHPFLLWIHGGPLGSYRDEFHYRWNPALYAAAGYVVVLVNPAGSTGFGQELVESNHADWGRTCFQDLMAAADRWCAEPHVDENRTAALGASFGGYMVNWIAGHADRFRCLVCHAGLFHLPAFHGTTDAGPNWEIEFGGPPWEPGSAYEEHSPHRAVENWTTPTLVIHGELDYRVPVGEGLAAYLALQRRGVESKFLYFPDENHWILKPANLVQWNREVLAWLHGHLGEKGSDPSS